jgi:hypothetical protein
MWQWQQQKSYYEHILSLPCFLPWLDIAYLIKGYHWPGTSGLRGLSPHESQDVGFLLWILLPPVSRFDELRKLSTIQSLGTSAFGWVNSAQLCPVLLRLSEGLGNSACLPYSDRLDWIPCRRLRLLCQMGAGRPITTQVHLSSCSFWCGMVEFSSMCLLAYAFFQNIYTN